MSVSAIVPAWNEADRIQATVETLKRVNGIDEVVVVDDGSTDGTADVATGAGARVVRRATNAGKGAAVGEGIRRAAGEVLLLIDADLGPSASIASLLLAPVLDDEADMTIAAPPPSGPSGFGLVERYSRWALRRATGRRFARPLSGQRCLRRSAVEDARLPRGFGLEVALTAHVMRRGFRVTEVSVPVEHRRTARDLRGFVHRGRQGLAVAVESVRLGIRWRR